MSVATDTDRIKESLSALAGRCLQAQPPNLPYNTASGIMPPVPETLAETGISPAIFEHLVLKYLYFKGEMLGREIAGQLGVQFSLIDELLETLKRQHYVGVKKSMGMGNASGVFEADRAAGRNLTRGGIWKTTCMRDQLPCLCHQYSEVVCGGSGWKKLELAQSGFVEASVPAFGGGAGRAGADRPGGELQ